MFYSQSLFGNRVSRTDLRFRVFDTWSANDKDRDVREEVAGQVILVAVQGKSQMRFRYE